jgi:hypothetical protein
MQSYSNDVDLSLLANAMTAIFGLSVHLRIEGDIIENDRIGYCISIN